MVKVSLLKVGWGRVIPGQGNSGTVRAISDKKYFHQVKQSIWPKNYRNIVGRHPLHVPVALVFGTLASSLVKGEHIVHAPVPKLPCFLKINHKNHRATCSLQILRVQ